MEQKLQELKMRLAEAADLDAAAALLTWDQSTYMPPGGALARARQLATLTRLYHERFTDPAVGRLLDDLRPYEESLPYDSDDASLVRVTRREFERMTRIPSDFLGDFYQHSSSAYQAWTQAHKENDFQRMIPFLEKTLELSRRLANFFPGYQHIADPLIDFADYGMKASALRQLFATLRQHLSPLVLAIAAQPPIDDSCLFKRYPEERQLAFGSAVIRRMGYDFDRGRQDKTHHPFTTKFSLGDVRITTRVQENYLGDALFSTIHEAGHAIYEQGIPMAFEGTTLAGGTSSGVHESQSRLFENIVGRSRSFWHYYYPSLQDMFPEQLREVPEEAFYAAINKVTPSFIRTDADEVTYNLHIILRFDLELDLLEGRLEVKDLPRAWHERFDQDLGLVVPDDARGVMQDVHWFGGWIGGVFQGYTLGNLLSAQFLEAALQAHPEIPGEISQGQFGTLHAWLKENIYQHGRKFTEPELVQRVTGEPIRVEPFIQYLHQKYDALYHLNT